jgi:hypothetical protein
MAGPARRAEEVTLQERSSQRARDLADRAQPAPFGVDEPAAQLLVG